MSEKPLGPTTNKQPSGNQKAEQAVSIQTKVNTFTEVQRSLEEIKNVLNTLSAKQIPDGVTDESETEGTPGSIRIVKNDLNQSLFEIKTEDGWKKPMVGKTAITFETIENNQKPIKAESIDEIEANDATTGDNKANNTIYDEKASKFILPRPDFSSSWYRVDYASFNDGSPRFMIEHGLGVLPTFFITWFAPAQGSGGHGSVVEDSAITWITPINNEFGYKNDNGIASKVDINYAIYGAGNDRLWASTNFLGSLTDTPYTNGCIKFVAWK
tara:strand:+ start:1377 stop:2186 length:810 start_codon:yes stop_codon:yes gene_type:complete